MSIIEILNDKNTEVSERLELVADVVREVRESYGNQDDEVPSVDVQTATGNVCFTSLNDDSKVALLIDEVNAIRTCAIEYARHQKGGRANKRIEELIATSNKFCNITNGEKYDYV